MASVNCKEVMLDSQFISRFMEKNDDTTWCCLLCSDFVRTELRVISHINTVHFKNAPCLHGGQCVGCESENKIPLCKKLGRAESHYHCAYCDSIFFEKK